MIHEFTTWLVDVIGQWGYPGILVLMTLESSFFPVPSELVMIPAGYLVFTGEMNAPVAIALGVVGSWLGALVNYGLAVMLGRPFLIKYGKFILLNERKFIMMEEFFRRHGEIATFTGRLIPVIRHGISFPAGLARMKMSHFIFFTGLGAGIWVTILVFIGYIAGANQELIKKHLHTATVCVIVGCVLLIGTYVYLHRKKARREKDNQVNP